MYPEMGTNGADDWVRKPGHLTARDPARGPARRNGAHGYKEDAIDCSRSPSHDIDSTLL